MPPMLPSATAPVAPVRATYDLPGLSSIGEASAVEVVALSFDALTLHQAGTLHNSVPIDAASEAGSDASYFTNRWLPADMLSEAGDADAVQPPWRPNNPPQRPPPPNPRIAGGAVRGIVLTRIRAEAKGADTLVAPAIGRSARVLSGKQLDTIAGMTEYMTQEEAAKHAEEVLAQAPAAKFVSREERERKKLELAREKAAAKSEFAAKALEPNRWVRFLRTPARPIDPPYVTTEVGVPVQIVGLSKRRTAAITADGSRCPQEDEGTLWVFCKQPSAQ